LSKNVEHRAANNERRNTMEAPLGRKRLFFATLVLLVAVATQAQADDAIPISSADDSAIRLAAEVPDWAEGKMQLNLLERMKSSS
jgi:hypothetical protein